VSAVPLLELEHLHVELPGPGGGHVPVIHDVSLALAPGESLGLVGESGSGKSMTVRSITRLLPDGAAVDGEIRFAGHPVGAMTRRDLRAYRAHDVALIHQDPRAHVNPVRTVGDFLTEALCRVDGVSRPEADERAAGLLRSVGIADAERRLCQYPHQLSGGLLQRAMIAAALMGEPRLILADEPTTALDVTTQEEVMGILADLRDEHGVALVLVTHDLDLAAAVTDRVAVMYAGVIVEVAPSAELHDSARHPYTAGLLASRPGSARVGRLRTIPGRPIPASEAGEGCVFASRCPFALDRCRAERPGRRLVGGHSVACHRAEEWCGRIDYPTEVGV
jgi:oligopeptide/dipeptide ABC transporter ATP-binding protein